MIIEQPAVFLRWIYPHALWRMDKREKAVYLTFDDGPIPEATPFILDTLERFGAKATFFMVGDNAQKYPHLLAEVKARGHRIGNHTYNHIGGLRWWSWHYLANVVRANKILKTDLFRPPHGWIITFHDSLKSIDKLKHALPEALQWLAQEGYEFKVFD